MHSINPDIEYIIVTSHNMPQALEVQRQIWPNSAVDADYLAKPKTPADRSNVSWLVMYQGKLAGLTGVFAFDPDEPGYDDGESIWLDWFAILPDYRGRHMGRQVLIDTIDYCRSPGQYQYFRIDTTYAPGRAAVALYDSVMSLREPYTAEDQPGQPQNYLIYTISLHDSPVKPWANHFLALGTNSEGEIIN